MLNKVTNMGTSWVDGNVNQRNALREELERREDLVRKERNLSEDVVKVTSI
jgi:hypothetical protein